MSELAFRPWTIEAFFGWQAEQEGRFELVGGFPLRMMTGASNRHDIIVVNISGELRVRLRGSGCRPFSADGCIETYPGQIRRPDVGVNCGPLDPDAFTADNPVAVFEVLSPSTRDFDRFRKLAEYRAVASIRHIAFVETREPLIYFWSRPEGGDWSEVIVRGLDSSLDLAAVNVVLSLSDIYEDIAFVTAL